MKTSLRAHAACASRSLFNGISCHLRVAALAATALLVCSGAQAQSPYLSELRAFAFGYCPKYWFPANGAILAIQTNQALFALTGTTYGGDGIRTFTLPDLRGRTPVGWGNDTLGNNYQRGQSDGRETTSITTAQMPSHTHQPIATTDPATHATPTANALLAQAQNAGLYVDSAAANTTLDTAPAGTGQAVSTRDPYLAITWCVATQGVFPSSN
ncbi:phage tail protein [Acidovorax radicis]|jgi:microcystin-dependent protein|uniref:phage tail protein n=1 Tax=Acidovorax radicis TaxID=758826 RepID=UPI001CF94B20|nr:tail fiber protein [Acidovorax radicis]UCV01066.1 tail fiber protein [Acidovorax radicis]